MGIRIRWIYAACYEIELSNGIHIVTDPFITPKIPKERFSLEDIEKADYILITHTHYDHISDLKALAYKFHPKVIAGSASVRELIRYCDFSFDLIYPVNPGETLVFDDVRIDVSRAKHSLRGRPESPASDVLGAGEKIYGVTGTDEVMTYGYLESLDFLITDVCNTKIMMSSGGMELLNSVKEAEKHMPNILIRQASAKQEPVEFAQMLSLYHACVNFPFHHEGIGKSGYTIEEYMHLADAALEQMIPGASVVNPQQFKWYHIGFRVSVE